MSFSDEFEGKLVETLLREYRLKDCCHVVLSCSLLRALMSAGKKTEGTKGEDITDGIIIQPWAVKSDSGVEVTYSTWDFAGQTLYYNTHQVSHRRTDTHLVSHTWTDTVLQHSPGESQVDIHSLGESHVDRHCTTTLTR